MDIGTLVNQMRNDGIIRDIVRNPLAQFGLGPRRYIGAELLPERVVPENSFREENIRYKTIIANDGNRYSPVQKKGGELVGSFEVILGDSDIGREFSGRDYDVFLKLIGNASMDAAVQLMNWLDVTITRAMVELCEKQRWELIQTAQIVRRGANGFSETVTISNPSGHRANAGGTWSNNSYDPYADIVAMVNLLKSKGYTVTRIITRRPVISILTLNEKMRNRMGITTMAPGVMAGVAPGFLDLASMNAIFSRDGLPPLEEYDLQYRTTSGSSYFLSGNTMVFICQTGRDESIDYGDGTKIVTDTLGYTAIGRATGQQDPGRHADMWAFTTRPPRIESQGWQTTLPIITEPEAVACINNIA